VVKAKTLGDLNVATIIYAEEILDRSGGELTAAREKDVFREAGRIWRQLADAGQKSACFFVDPLLDTFAAANHFYFQILGCDRLHKLNCYRSGAGPIQALFDAQALVDHQLYDAVFIFGCEPLLTNRRLYGREAIRRAMDIFADGGSLLNCYHVMSRLLCRELGLTDSDFYALAEALYQNYRRAFARLHPGADVADRGRNLAALQGELFYLTDCANPNVDFAGGIIVSSATAAERLDVPAERRLDILAVRQAVVEGSPESLAKIIGRWPVLLPHLRDAFHALRRDCGLDLAREWRERRLLLDVYTCYPPIPLAFLLTCGFAASVAELPDLLREYPVTWTGGLNFAGAPWNNPVLHSLISLYQQLNALEAERFLVHGNGGVGELQGVALLGRAG
jgi:hypothetical protein